jgi:fructoselysine 3-epimerase
MPGISMQNFAVMNVQYWHYSFEYFLQSMEKCRLRKIEFWGGAPHYCHDDHRTARQAEKKIASLRTQIEDRGMQVITYTPEQLNYPINIAGRDKAYREKSLAYFVQAMQDALAFGTDRLFITSGWGLLDEPREDAWTRSVESLRTLTEEAEKLSVTLIMEQLQPYESNLLTTCTEMRRMLLEVGSEALQCCVDLVAMAVVGDELQAFFDQLPGRVHHVHFADGTPSGHYICGEGRLPLREYLQTLEANHYCESLTLEINDSIYWDDPHASIEKSAAWLRQILPEEWPRS